MSQNGKVTKPSLKGQCQEMEFETLCECLVSVKTCAKLLSGDLKGLFEDKITEGRKFRFQTSLRLLSDSIVCYCMLCLMINKMSEIYVTDRWSVPVRWLHELLLIIQYKLFEMYSKT